MSNCFILAKTSVSYSSETVRSVRQGYLNTQFGNVGSTSLGDWNDVTNAIGVMGVQNFHIYLGLNVGEDVFFVTNNGYLIDGSRNYFVSYFSGTRAPGGYYQYDGRSDGINAIVLGSFTNTLPILGRITTFKSLGGKAFLLKQFLS